MGERVEEDGDRHAEEEQQVGKGEGAHPSPAPVHPHDPEEPYQKTHHPEACLLDHIARKVQQQSKGNQRQRRSPRFLRNGGQFCPTHHDDGSHQPGNHQAQFIIAPLLSSPLINRLQPTEHRIGLDVAQGGVAQEVEEREPRRNNQPKGCLVRQAVPQRSQFLKHRRLQAPQK